MKILGVDTSTSVNTVALCQDARIVAETVVDCGRAHAERLMATVDWVVGEAGIAIGAIDLLAVSTGPGSFTGIRIGVAAWKGLALAAGLPLAGVSTLDAMARAGAFQDAIVCPLLDAKMNEVFGAVYRFDAGVREKLVADCVAPVEHFLSIAPEDAIFFGDGADLYRGKIVETRPHARVLAEFRSPRASAVCFEAAEVFARSGEVSAGAVNPVYLRMSQPEVVRAKAST